ncbi:M1-specific T cell receptor beta chain-like isoform 8-T8 [Pholidichthys leucotaenia]
MTLGIIFWAFVILWTAGVSECVLITQWPRDISSSPGSSAEIHCYQNDTDYQNLYWYRQLRGNDFQLIVYLLATTASYEDGFKSGFTAKNLKNKQWSLTISSVREEDEAFYLCAANHCDNANEAHFGKGTKLTVLEKDRSVTPPTVKVIRPSPRECTNQKDKGKKKTIVCVASGFYPDHVSVLWKIDGENVTNNVATDEDAKMVGDFYRITSRLRVSREDYYSNPKKEFTCEVSFFNKTHTTYHSDGISSDEDKQTVTMTREKYLSITQSAKLSYGVLIVKSCVYGAFVCFLVWKLQGSGKPIK